MTKPISRKMAVDCLLWLIAEKGGFHVCADWSRRTDGSVNGVVYKFRCYICDGSITAGEDIQFDHVHADIHGGPHEYQNLRPVHTECHKKKTARDIKANAKVKRIQKGGKKRKGPPMKSGKKLQTKPMKDNFKPRVRDINDA